MCPLVIDQNREEKPFLLRIGFDVFRSMFTGKFRRVNADNGKIFVSERLMPILVPRIIANAVDSGEGVEV